MSNPNNKKNPGTDENKSRDDDDTKDMRNRVNPEMDAPIPEEDNNGQPI